MTGGQQETPRDARRFFANAAEYNRRLQSLAQAAGAGGRTWRAYLSTTEAPGQPAVNVRDGIGLRDDAPSRSWNASHPSRGCALDDLRKSGGAGMIYCFAANRAVRLNGAAPTR